jgi:choline dehydrogenase-like flavoprotein
MTQHFEADVAVIGTGAGGGTLAYALKDSGAEILLLERGGFLPSEAENWSPAAVFGEQRYKTTERWRDGTGRSFRPGMHYFVGGNTKVYGAALPRLRCEDFSAYDHADGNSPAWPITYEELEPYYQRAEVLYRVHGTATEDPTEPPRSGPYPFPPVPDEPEIARLRERLLAQGLHPYSIPLGIDLAVGGTCVRCATCDGYPCRVHAKSDADTRAVRPALESQAVTLRTHAFVERLVTTSDGDRVTQAHGVGSDGPFTVSAKTFVIACGAVNSAALLLRSRSAAHPDGLANSSGHVGRNYMSHVHTGILALGPHRNHTSFQKTLAVNDYYLQTDDSPHRMGTLWLIGKIRGPMLRAVIERVPASISGLVAAHSVDWWACTEDVPKPDNRVTLDPDGTIRIAWTPNDLGPHQRLVSRARQVLRQAGYKFVLTRRMGIEFNAHQCGTVRFGSDPRDSVLNPLCRAHDVSNLYVVDASFFPSSAALNPVLTIAAQALRVADQIGSCSGPRPVCRWSCT